MKQSNSCINFWYSCRDAGHGAKYCSSPHAADLHHYSHPTMLPSYLRAPYISYASGSTSPTPLAASPHIHSRVQPHQQQSIAYPKAHMLMVDSPSVKSALLVSMMPQQPITPQHAGSAAFVPCSSYFEGTPSTDSSIVGDAGGQLAYNMSLLTTYAHAAVCKSMSI